jgi:hypothetical protein
MELFRDLQPVNQANPPPENMINLCTCTKMITCPAPPKIMSCLPLIIIIIIYDIYSIPIGMSSGSTAGSEVEVEDIHDLMV